MRFGNTPAVVRVGRDANVGSAMAPGRRMAGAFDPFSGYAQRAPTSVRVGRAQGSQIAPPRTRVGQTAAQAAAAANTPSPVVDTSLIGTRFANVPLVGCAAAYDWTNSCVRTNGTGRQLVAPGATLPITVTTCGPARVLCIVVPESFALHFQINQIQICRDLFINGGPLPAEALSDQS